MTKIQDLYESRVRPMAPAERLQLARLILDDLAPSETVVDVSDEWNNDDLADLAAYSTQYAGQPTPMFMSTACLTSTANIDRRE